ncbi:BrxE family protein [Geomonas sp. Red69]|uniref:BrxE family protein n=1 Tax=Geomonas diazotrophica TaxID=2843197 RepID=UPI001C10F5BF|nr:BrxE family protein [Geomonas diazotrophica]MBU5638833.1 BrxE family protein [Geomonas diazotrophica]
MKNSAVPDLLSVRMLVGFLGEKSQYNWWPTSFIGPSSSLFLSPVFPRTTLLSQYHGILEAARRLHDERIGLGSVFHLFRLPEAYEHDLHSLISDGGYSLPLESFANKDSALAALEKISGGDAPPSEGPVKLGNAQEIMTAGAIRSISCCYAAAFSEGIYSYPYFVS